MDSPLDTFTTIPHLLIQGPDTHVKYKKIYKFLTDHTERPSHVHFMSCAHIDPSAHSSYIQTHVYLFAQIKSTCTRFVVFDHAEFLTIDAQSILRRYIEQFSKNVRFIFIVSPGGTHSLIVPILSRLYKLFLSDTTDPLFPLPGLSDDTYPSSIQEQYDWINQTYQSATPLPRNMSLTAHLTIGNECWKSDKLCMFSRMNV